MTAAAFRLLVFTALAVGSAALWLSLLHSGDLHTSLGQAIAPEASQSIFAPATRSADQASGIEQLPHSLGPGLAVQRIVSGGRCSACALQLGPGGLVRAQAGTGSASRNAYALLDLSEQAAAGSIVARDALSLGRGESPPARPG